MNRLIRLISAVLLFSLAGCDSPELDPNISQAIGRCIYINGFSKNLECKEYLGSNWTAEAIADNCAAPVPGSDPGTYEPGLACDRNQILGECFVDPGTVEAATIVFPGEEGDSCNGLSMGCGFAGGEYVPAAACGGEDPLINDPGPAEPFIPFHQVCMDPLPGEPPGMGPDGQVCTWEAISGATEAGRSYTDYADCAPVLTQRPYWVADAHSSTDPNDPRYQEKSFQTEYAWATQEIEATACVCCHSLKDSPDTGPSGWHIGMAGLWTDGLDDDGLAVLAGWIDSTAFGAFEPQDNNGFHRTDIGLPTTDPERMRNFLEGELERRGLSPADFEGAQAFGGPLADQMFYEPTACTNGNGVDANGLINWSGGGIRYLYILEGDAESPGVPPNRNLPEGTIWHFDISPAQASLPSGVQYGELPEGATQVFPASGAPAALESGRTYYLYALMDIALPLTRCLFVAP